jgi:hypothetical protein
VTGRSVFLCLLAHALFGAGAAAQAVEVAGYGAAVTNSEVDRVRQSRGLGVGADVSVRFGRIEVTARGLTASLRGDFSIQPDYALHQLEAAVSYQWRKGISGHIAITRRFLDPEFLGQDVGMMRVGVSSRTWLTSLAAVQASVAYIPLTRFSGGGGSDLAVELGLGLRVGRQTGRVSGHLAYTYERIDREVEGSSAPIRFSVGRIGVSMRL